MRVILAISGLMILLGGVLFAIDVVRSDQIENEGFTEEPGLVMNEVREVPEIPAERVPFETPTEEAPPEESPKEIEPETPTKRNLVERLDGRSIRLDGRFVLTGNGTERDPYTISWELLASARDSIDAAKGLLEPPPYIELLDGAWVRIDGYYSTPLVSESVSEVLLTLNRWDGCCIGLPPTPFDCVETNLSKPINMRSKHLVRFGTVTGRMAIQPFAIGNWLMGLYRLDNATLDMGSM
jgi:hypothetical protein